MKKIIALSVAILIVAAHVLAQKAEVYSSGGKAIKDMIRWLSLQNQNR